MKLLPVTLLALFLLGCNKPQEVKVYNVCLTYDTIMVYDTIATPRLSSSGVGIFFDQKTGATVSLMYKGRSFVPIEERDSLLKATIKLDIQRLEEFLEKEKELLERRKEISGLAKLLKKLKYVSYDADEMISDYCLKHYDNEGKYIVQ